MLALAALMGLLLWPRTMVNADEFRYAGQARLLLQGRMTWAEGAPLPGGEGYPEDGIRYPYGWPLLLAPAALLGFRALHVVPLIMLLIGGAAFARILVRRSLPSYLVGVFVFHPLFWSFSRTLMSDVPSVALALGAIDAWEHRQRPARSGALLGYSLFMRLASLFSIMGFGVATLSRWGKRRREVILLVVGGGCAAILLGLQFMLVRSGPAHSPYAFGGWSMLGWRGAGEHLALSIGGLLLIPPFPLLALLARHRACDRWALGAIPVVVFFLAYTYNDESGRWVETFLGGQRLILPAHAFLMVSTARVWGRIPLLSTLPVMLAAGSIGPLVHTSALEHLTHRYADATEAIRSCDAGVIAYTRSAARVALANDARSFHLIDYRDPPAGADVAVVAFATPTNRPTSQGGGYELSGFLASHMTSCRQFGEFYVFDLTGRCPDQGLPCHLPH